MSLTNAALLSDIADEMERAIQNAERPKGGQHAGSPSGDFWPVGPGVIGRFKWWLREIRNSRNAQRLDGETYRSLYISTMRGEAIYATALFEHIERVVQSYVILEEMNQKLVTERDAARQEADEWKARALAADRGYGDSFRDERDAALAKLDALRKLAP